MKTLEEEKHPIPNWCKANCKFRDKKAKHMPACQYLGKLIVEDILYTGNEKRPTCLSYNPFESKSIN